MRIPKKPRIYIRDQRDVVVDVLRPKDYYDTNLGSYMKGNTARFKFTMIKKPTTFADLTVVNNLAFRYDNVDYWLACMIIDQNETTATVEAWPLGLEWANEEVGPYKAGSAMTFEQYFNILSYQKSIVLNINEVDEKKITYEWDGTQTKLERLYSLATVFNAEIEFKTELNVDGSLLRQVLNVYKEHDDNNQGMGLDRRNEVFRYGKDIKSINYNVDKTELKTAIIGTGKDGLTIASIEAEVKDADGNLLYATYKTAKPGMEDPKKIYAVQAVEQFPSQTNISDKWTVAISGDSDHTTAQALYGYLLSELKKLSTPNVTWDVQGWVDGNVGDTIRIRDDGYQPPLLLEARISEQHRDLDDPSQNTTTFTNVEILKSKLSQNIMAQVAALIEANKQYQASIETEGGFAFKNNQGQSIFHAVIRDGALDVTDKFKLQWYKDSVYIGNAKDITVLGTDIVDKSLYYYEYYDDTNTLRGRVELTVTNTNDGAPGKDGKDGINGTDGVAGKDGVGLLDTEVKWAQSTSGTISPSTGWQTQVPTLIKGQYLWTRTIWYYTDGTNETGFSVSYNAKDGNNGTDGGIGPQGPPGVDGKEVFSGYLSNDSIVVPANNAGTVTDFSKANGTFTTFLGQVQLTSGVVYSLVSNSGLTSTINATTGAYSVTAISADTATATYKAVYNGITIQKILIVTKAKQGPNGATGPAGAPTGIVAQTTAPASPYVGMLWKNTTAGNGATYRWTGSAWEAYVFTALNISAENLSAIVSRIGEIYNDYSRTYNDGTTAVGTLAIKDAEINNSGVIKNSSGTTIQTYESIVSHQLISMARYSGAGSVGDQNKLVASLGLTFNTLSLNDKEKGFAGTLTAEEIMDTGWVYLTVLSGTGKVAIRRRFGRFLILLDDWRPADKDTQQIVQLSGSMNPGKAQMIFAPAWNLQTVADKFQLNTDGSFHKITKSNGTSYFRTIIELYP